MSDSGTRPDRRGWRLGAALVAVVGAILGFLVLEVWKQRRESDELHRQEVLAAQRTDWLRTADSLEAAAAAADRQRHADSLFRVGLEDLASVSDADLDAVVELAARNAADKERWEAFRVERNRRESRRYKESRKQAEARDAEEGARRIAQLERLTRECPKASKARILRLVRSYPGWTDKLTATVACGAVDVGMRPPEVVASLGEPDDVNRSVGSWGVHEQWVYGFSYVYFENGFVTSWSD